MAVPRNRHSNGRTRSRRAHHALDPRQGTACANCGAVKLPHRICGSCGVYRGRVLQPQSGDQTATEE